jgi:hypothetical protein
MLTQNSYTISIGRGGAGGSGSRYTGGAGGNGGGPGAAGQYTTFGGTMVSASGGSGGAGGAPINPSIGGVGGNSLNCLPGPGFAINGGSGSNNSVVNNAPSPLTFFSSSTNVSTVGASPITSTAGGGTGAGVDVNGIFLSGSYGASGIEWNTLKLNNTTNGNSGSANLVNGIVLLQFTSSIFSINYGLGGGGNGNVTPGNYTTPGGNGGLYGAGGGGSAFYRGAANTSGPVGGSGSSGLCIVVEYY